MKISENCLDQKERRRLIRAHRNAEGESDLNGIDYVEVDERQRVLTVFFLGKAPEEIQKENVRIEGGTRIRGIGVERIRLCRIDDPERDDCLKVFVDKYGDYSTYTLKLVNVYGGRPSAEPFEGFDPRYAQIEFSFKANCPTELDCRDESVCAPETGPEPEINYLAKDYASFRQLILDRLALVMPEWKERHVPDIGIALVEILAYTGDYLSYYQDAVGSESYLDTARQRISVRRHTTLVDYQLHEGCNARAWVCVEVKIDFAGDSGILPENIYFITRADSFLPQSITQRSSSRRNVLDTEDLSGVSPKRYTVFEPLVQDAQARLNFYKEHNELRFYTWRDSQCCLPRGATSATLDDDPGEQNGDETPPSIDYNYDGQVTRQEKRDEQRQQQAHDQKTAKQGEHREERPRRLRLRAGDVLIFEEVLGPNTGVKEDADPSHRHAVRLTKVEPDVDSLTGTLVLNIEWALEDALPFELCLSSIGRAPDCKLIQDVSVARGNVVLCDQGRTVESEEWTVPEGEKEDAGCFGENEPREPILRAGYFRPKLDKAPLTHCVPLTQSSVVARNQAKALGGVMARVRILVIESLKYTRRRGTLSPAALNDLETIFGKRYLAEVGLVVSDKRERYPQSEDVQAAALERLLSRLEGFLEKKRRRLEVLRRRALAGYVLTKLEHQELIDLFGQSLIEALGLVDDSMLGPASAALQQNPRDAVPAIVVYESPAETSSDKQDDETSDQLKQWTPRGNLLRSHSRDRHFVAEVDDEGLAHLRFGDNDLGRTPKANSILKAKYRVEQGLSGNVGPECITHLVFRRNRSGTPGDVLRVRNPLPARGGTMPERIEEAKLYAPTAFRKVLQRAITAEDYASLAESANQTSVQQAAASLSWSGSWYEVQVAVDPRGTEEADERLLEEIGDSLAPSRRMGHDLSVKLARYVPLNIALTVCVLPQYLRGHVKAALTDLFSNRRLPNGQLGLFHPDNLTFGDDIYLSKLVAAAQGVPGVENVQASTLERLYEGSNDEIENGVLSLGPLEVARLDNDPSFPENGQLLLTMRGGR